MRPAPTTPIPAHAAVYARHVRPGAHPDECYGWAGPLTQDGYPRVRAYGARETVGARVAWWALYGVVPDAVVPMVCSVLRRMVKYVREDRATTPGVTRLARLTEEADAHLSA